VISISDDLTIAMPRDDMSTPALPGGFDITDPELSADPAGAAAEIIGYAAELGHSRITAPRDNI
jgi:hypothetical protein